MTTPFVYLLTHKRTGIRYLGSRYKEGCHPSQLLVSYPTSSKLVKEIINDEGIDAFDKEIRKTFTCKKKCRAYEAKVLRRLDAARSRHWLNKHNGNGKLNGASGWNHSEESKRKISKALSGTTKPQHVKDAVAEANKIRVISDQTRKKLSLSSTGANNPMFGRKRPEMKAILASSRESMMQANRCPVMCEGTEYASVGHAELAYPGVSIRKRLDNPNHPNFYRLRERTKRK